MYHYKTKYGIQATFYFELKDYGTTDLITGATFQAGDAQITKDGGALNPTDNNPVSVGGGLYKIILTATELTCAKPCVVIKDQTTGKVYDDTSIFIDTYGNASAAHEFDLDSAGVQLSTQGKADVNAEAKDVIYTDTITELSAGAPATTPTVSTAIMLLYMALRNERIVTADTVIVKNNAGTAVCQGTVTKAGAQITLSKLGAP